MIRRILIAGYNRTVGYARDTVSSLVSSVARGGILQLLYILILVGLMAGFINAVFFAIPNQGIVVYPGGGAQTIPEMFLDGFVIAVGGAGIYLAYVSGRQTTRARTVNLYLGLALLLIAVSMLTGIDLAIIKGFG